MAAPPNNKLQNMLQAAVQSVQWTYSLYWQICPQEGKLVWSEGYYNGAIKTRKTVQPMEVSAEEASLQRSQQLRELYESLSAGETNQPVRRPCASLSPEDLTESEWFYLMCVSFSFPPGVGLPGKAYARRQHVWLTGANEVDSKTFSRAILAKGAQIQTVVCIPLLEGIIELGFTDKVKEDLAFVQHIKTFFNDQNTQHHLPPPPKPALSGHSTSNPPSSNHLRGFHSPPLPATYAATDPPVISNQVEDEEEDDDEDEEEEEEEEEEELDSETQMARNSIAVPAQNGDAVAEPSELMQLEMSEDIRLGSPDDASNNLDSDLNLLGGNINAVDQQGLADSFRAELTRRWQVMQGPLSSSLQLPPNSGPTSLKDPEIAEDKHYSQTVSTIIESQQTRWAESCSTAYLPYSTQSAFAKWTTRSDHHHLLHVPVDGTSQWLLKYILFSVPYLHTKYRDENSPKSRDGDSTRFRRGTPQDELSANHVLAERRRREKLNERFIILRSLVPFVTKMDKASILGDTIEYVKQLRNKVQDLEARNRQTETDPRSRSAEPGLQRSSDLSLNEQRSGVTVVERARVGLGPGSDKRKLRIVEGSDGAAKPKTVEPPVIEAGTSVEVSIIESDALLELQCAHREGLLLDIMQLLRELRIETTAVQSSSINGVFVAELRAKVKESIVNGKKISITEVKRAVNQIIAES
ncbi:transcription factor BHLH42-like isoform X2 [Tripterygium wilfordii]|uniref:transcription factor BHLH42-like isoform X2 n=1 Tax=Tripterygium wilfordii TaxID=458696 RepID=UPI0018F84E1F|nr:transcription factor BHLH42-like isoform X2 [Tripterygium wilfordii]